MRLPVGLTWFPRGGWWVVWPGGGGVSNTSTSLQCTLQSHSYWDSPATSPFPSPSDTCTLCIWGLGVASHDEGVVQRGGGGLAGPYAECVPALKLQQLVQSTTSRSWGYPPPEDQHMYQMCNMKKWPGAKPCMWLGGPSNSGLLI